MNRLVCLRWISKTQRKENFSREARVAPLEPSWDEPVQPRRLARIVTRLHNKRCRGRLHLKARPWRDRANNGEPLQLGCYTLREQPYKFYRAGGI
jgi:hypothetical protein